MKCRDCNKKYDPRLQAVHEKTLRHRLGRVIVQLGGMLYWS